MHTVGFIGLGTMGRPMARNLLKAGHRLVFFARRDDVAEEFTALGAVRAASPAEVARQADFVVTIVTADPQVREVALGRGGLVEGAAPGKMLIEMSTIGPDTTRDVGARLAQGGMAMIDAPVSGGPWGAEAGTLTIMAGGAEQDVVRARPVLEAMGSNIFHLGPLGTGQTVKLINQMVAGGIMVLVGEGLALAQAAGADLEKLVDVMLVSSANSAVLEARGRKFILADRYVPGFMTQLMRKDVALAVGLAQDLNVPTPVASCALALYTAAMNQGLGEADFAAVTKVSRGAAGQAGGLSD